MALEMGSVPVESLGGSNMQKGPRGLGQMLGPKVKNSETLEFYFLMKIPINDNTVVYGVSVNAAWCSKSVTRV